MADFYPLVKDAGITKALPAADTLFASNLSREAAGAITIGGTVATSVVLGGAASVLTSLTIGKTGVMTTVLGDLTVNGTESVVGNTTFAEDVALGDAADDHITFNGEVNSDINFDSAAARAIRVATAAVGVDLTLEGGVGSAGAGGDLVLNGGLGSGAEGEVQVGAANTSNITIGNAADTTTVDFAGDGAITATGNPTWNFGTSQADFGGNVDANAGLDVTGTLSVGGYTIVASGDALVLGGDAGNDAAPAMVTLTTVQRTALTGVNGMICYDSDLSAMYMYVSGAWTAVGAGGSGSGTTNVSWVVNSDGATTNEDSFLALYSGDGVSAFQGFWTLNASTDPPILEYKVTDDGTPDSPILGVGEAGVTASSDAELRLNSGTGAATRQASIKMDSATQDLIIGGTNLTAVSTTVNLDAELGLDVTGGSLTVTGQSLTHAPVDNTASVFTIIEGGNEYIVVDTTDGSELVTLGDGVVVVDVPSGAQFSIGGSVLPAQWTAANVTTLLDGSDADSLHTHAGLGVIEGINTNTFTIGDIVYISGANAATRADASAIATAIVAGVVVTAAAAGSIIQSGKVTVRSNVDVVAGDRLYLSTTTGLVCRSGGANAPSALGDVWIAVGVALTNHNGGTGTCTALWDLGEPSVI